MPEQPGSSADAVAVPVSLRFNCQHCRKRITAVANKEPIWITDVQCGICGMHHSIQWINGQWDVRATGRTLDQQCQSVSIPRPFIEPVDHTSPDAIG